MSSRRILQAVASRSIQLSAKRALVVPGVRAAVSVHRGFIPAVPSFTWKREFNSKPEGSDIFKVIDYNDIQNIIKKEGKGYHLIDVREPKEYVGGAIPTSKNVPLSQFEGWSLSNEQFKDQFGFDKPATDSSVILYCLGGVRSTKAAQYLSSLGYNNLENYVGSWADYVEKQKGGK